MNRILKALKEREQVFSFRRTEGKNSFLISDVPGNFRRAKGILKLFVLLKDPQYSVYSARAYVQDSKV